MSKTPNTKAKTVVSAKPPSLGHNSDDRTNKNLLVSTYLQHHKEEGAHFVQKCKIVVEAEDVLSSNMFKEFCSDVGLPRSSSMFRKARAVANAADRLLALGDRLPDAKSTIYELAAVEENVFKEVAESDERITAARVRAARPSNPAKAEQCKFSVDATTLRHGERLTLLRVIKEEASKAGAKVTFPKSLQMEEVRP